MQNFFHLTECSVAFPQTLVALKRACCDVWKLEWQASNVTASVQSDHLLHTDTCFQSFSTDQLNRPPRSAEIQTISQQDASAIRPHRGLVLDNALLQYA